MILLRILFLILLITIPAFLPLDPIDNVADLIRKGDIHELCKSFPANTEVIISNKDNIYSKADAELVLNKFFSQNKPKSVKVLHRVNSNSKFSCGVLLLTADKGTFRVVYTLEEMAGNFMLIEMRIENGKAK